MTTPGPLDDRAPDSLVDRGSIASPAAPAAWPRLDVASDPAPPPIPDPGELLRTCANCGATMDERKCKLICRCGYFLSCSDYY